MWFLLWVLFVLMMIGFFVWSYHTTYEQKKNWKNFAGRYDLQYASTKMMAPPVVTGQLKNRQINLYAQQVENNQGQRSTQTVYEVFLNNVPDLIAVVSSQGFSDFVSALELPETFMVGHERWPKNSLCRTIEDELPEQWFLEERNRIVAIEKLFQLPVSVVFICDPDQAFVAVRTPNPLSSPKQLSQITKRLYDVAELLETVTAKEQEQEQESNTQYLGDESKQEE